MHSEILRLAEIKSQVKTALNCGAKYHLPTSVPCTERAFHRHLERLTLALKSGEDNRAKFEILHQKQFNVDANPTARVQGFSWISIGSLRLQQHWGIIETLQKFPKTSTETFKSNLVWVKKYVRVNCEWRVVDFHGQKNKDKKRKFKKPCRSRAVCLWQSWWWAAGDWLSQGSSPTLGAPALRVAPSARKLVCEVWKRTSNF